MRRLWIAALLAAALLPAAALDPNTVTIVATRTLTVLPDQAVLYVMLSAAPDAGLDAVLAQLKGTGITAANLVSVYSQSGIAPVDVPEPKTFNSQWTFSLPVLFTKMKDTTAALTQLQKDLGQSTLMFNVVGAQYSADALASQPCPYPALVSDARKQADALAAAAGMKSGAIVSVSDGTSVDGFGTGPAIGVPNLVSRTGDFSQLIGVTGFISSTLITSPQPACSLTVQFKLVP